MANFRMGGLPGLPMVIKNIVIINVLVWLAELTFKDDFVNMLALHYHQHNDFRIWQVVTYMFLHAPDSFFHILFNMLVLWMFGATLENLWGPKRFLTFYLICGIGAGVIQMLANYIEVSYWYNRLYSGEISETMLIEKIRGIVGSITLGASGAVMGVMAAYAYLFPNQELILIPIPIPIKAKWYVTGLILLDLFGGINPRYNSGIAHFAHVGGAIFGLILAYTMNRNNRRNFY